MRGQLEDSSKCSAQLEDSSKSNHAAVSLNQAQSRGNSICDQPKIIIFILLKTNSGI